MYFMIDNNQRVCAFIVVYSIMFHKKINKKKGDVISTQFTEQLT